MKNSNFKALVAQMNELKETEQGKLKGGITTLNTSPAAITADGNFLCGLNIFQCGKKSSPADVG